MTVIDTHRTLTARATSPSWPRIALAMSITAAVLIAALNFAVRGFVGLLFIGYLAMPLLVIVPLVAVTLISVTLFWCTGQRRIGAAIFVTISAFTTLGFTFVGFGTLPMLWVQPGFELVHPMIAVPAAMVIGLFLGSWRARIVGVIGAVLLIVVATWSNLPDAEQESFTSGPTQSEIVMDENYEAFIDSGDFPMVVDMQGGRLVGVIVDNGPFRSLNETVNGGLIEVVVDYAPIDSNPEVTPCWYISGPNMGLESTDTLADYASWCVRDGEEWRRTDGSGYARMENGSLIAVLSASNDNVRSSKSDHSATDVEVSKAKGSLRLMTETEVRTHVRWGK